MISRLPASCCGQPPRICGRPGRRHGPSRPSRRRTHTDTDPPTGGCETPAPAHPTPRRPGLPCCETPSDRGSQRADRPASWRPCTHTPAGPPTPKPALSACEAQKRREVAALPEPRDLQLDPTSPRVPPPAPIAVAMRGAVLRPTLTQLKHRPAPSPRTP